MRRRKLENIIALGKIEGRTGRGRPREQELEGLTLWPGKKSAAELLGNVEDRDLWRRMTTYATQHGT